MFVLLIDYMLPSVDDPWILTDHMDIYVIINASRFVCEIPMTIVYPIVLGSITTLRSIKLLLTRLSIDHIQILGVQM